MSNSLHQNILSVILPYLKKGTNMRPLATLGIVTLSLLFVGCSKPKETQTQEQLEKPTPQKTLEQKNEPTPAPKTSSTPQQSAFSAQNTYTSTCATCHGPYGKKHALNKSKVINGWSAAKLEEALYGYKDGTYGGAMKAVMAGQVKSYSKDELKALAEYISKLPAH